MIFLKALGEIVKDAPKKLQGAKIVTADILDVTDEAIALNEGDFKFSVNFSDIKKANLDVNLFSELRKES